jgi:hypothetical protein
MRHAVGRQQSWLRSRGWEEVTQARCARHGGRHAGVVSRTGGEALDRIQARVVRGRCLPHGKGLGLARVRGGEAAAALPSDPAAAAATRLAVGQSNWRVT